MNIIWMLLIFNIYYFVILFLSVYFAMMFISLELSLIVCHVLSYLCLVGHSGVQPILRSVLLRIVYPIFPVSLDCHWIFSNVYYVLLCFVCLFGHNGVQRMLCFSGGGLLFVSCVPNVASFSGFSIASSIFSDIHMHTVG